MGVSHARGIYGRVVITGGGHVRLPPSEHSHTLHFDQAHYLPVSGVSAEAGVKGDQAVVGSGRPGFGWYAYGSSEGGTDGGVTGDGQDGDGEGDG